MTYSLMHTNHSSASMMKRRRNHPQKILSPNLHNEASSTGTNVSEIYNSQEIKKKPMSHKEIAKEKEKEVEAYLL